MHRSLGKQERHRLYMRALRESGVNVELGRFKKKHVYCPKCGETFIGHEEKETDVAIAVRLFEVCLSDEAETIVLMTGDTDLAPAVRSCRRLFPDKLIFFAFPYRRANAELAGLAPESVAIKIRSCRRHQFPDPLVLSDGSELHKPANW